MIGEGDEERLNRAGMRSRGPGAPSEDDGFGVNDRDWDVYRAVVRDDSSFVVLRSVVPLSDTHHLYPYWCFDTVDSNTRMKRAGKNVHESTNWTHCWHALIRPTVTCVACAPPHIQWVFSVTHNDCNNEEGGDGLHHCDHNGKRGWRKESGVVMWVAV
jgi:hypothetical protein